MKRRFLFFLLISGFSCANPSSTEKGTLNAEQSNILENVTLSIDTLLVDSGEELFNLKDLVFFGKHNYFSLSQNKDSLYFFDRHRLILHEINLNPLKLINNYPFEEEGPNGVGRFVYTFKRLPNNQFYVRDLFGSSWLFSKDGKKLSSLELNIEELLEGTKLDPYSLANDQIFDLQRQKLYALPRSFISKEIYFAVLESMGETGRILKIPELEKTFNFFVELKGSADGGGGKGELVFLQQLNELVLISSSFHNSIYVYDPNLDSLFFKEFPHKLVPLGKEIEVKNEVFSQKEYQFELDRLHSQIDFWDFYWDEQSDRYYRFASKGLPLGNPDSPKEFEYYLFAYDQDFTLKGETRVNGLSELPLGGFFKDGKLWSYVNVEDELGFAVFTFDF